jgi:hypothetical protein
MSYVNNRAYIADKINNLKLKLVNDESAEGSVGVPAESFAITVIKLACILVIGVIIVQGIYTASGVNNTSAPFYSLAVSVQVR